ncbi:PREDICTED: B3 domain-containing protein REM5-like isoform X2 [Nicotiana attenuata]|uniref:B3 domain-containing protein REM5-like isoform X2 n=1 Tax=Nicotiana attenuata TaxID=49451 RepID=UPI000905AA68|nr:PREDICTED: B3 domain-containing protein REM5-like isoform X2 [Nicotiana attenuata]
MKIPPKKPHFFKPIMPGFKNGLKIPLGFLKYLKDHDHIEHAILRRGSKKWLVKVNGRRLEEGWEKFAEEHDLQLGDMLVFGHEGDMEFEVSVFHSNQCDREYEEEQKVHNVEETSKKFEFKEKPNPNIMSSLKVFPNVEATKDVPLGRPHLITTVKPSCISKCLMHVPKLFACENGLSNRKCTIVIRDEQRSWEFRLYSCGGSTFIGGEWRKFCAANFLKEGDHIMFEIFSKGEKPILKFCDLRGEASLQPEGKKTNLDSERVSTQDLRGNASLQPEGKKANLHTKRVSSEEKPSPSIKLPNKASADAKAAAHHPFGHSKFVCTIRPYCLTYGFLNVPKHFACANGLKPNKKCILIIRDERQGSWTLRLSVCKTQVYIGDGLRKFIADNCLKEGDRIMFEVVTSGETPIWKFQVVTSGKDSNEEVSR